MHPHMKYIFIIILFLFITICKGQNFTSTRYNMDNGLPQNSVKDIIKINMDLYGLLQRGMY